jgi:nucleotide-binding universal stress UspA family protein
MDTPTTRPIVAAYDFSESADAALDRALQLAGSRPATDLHVVGVVDDSVGPERWRGVASSPLAVTLGDRRDAELARDNLRAVVDARADGVIRGDTRLFVHLRIGHPVEEILQLADEAGAELIVVGTHGRRGARRWLLGSVAERLIRHARCSVLVARAGTYADDAALFRPEPPCPDCQARRTQTGGASWWCDVHAGDRVSPHVYSYRATTYTVGTPLTFE